MDALTELLTDAAWAPTPREAAGLYRRALEMMEPGSEGYVWASEDLGRALEKLGRDEALAYYRLMVVSDEAGDHHYAYERLPIMLEKQAARAEALETIRLAVRRGVPTGSTFRRRAWRIADAAGLARPFVPYRPAAWVTDRYTEMLWYWAELARERKAWSRAARRFARIQDGRYAEAQTRLGHCREKMGDVEGAISAYRRAVASYEEAHGREGDYAVVWRRSFDRLAILYERAGELDRAWDMVTRTLAVVRRNPPTSWWKRTERIAGRVGETLDREDWTPGAGPMERMVEGLAEGRREQVRQFAGEIGAFREERIAIRRR